MLLAETMSGRQDGQRIAAATLLRPHYQDPAPVSARDWVLWVWAGGTVFLKRKYNNFDSLLFAYGRCGRLLEFLNCDRVTPVKLLNTLEKVRKFV